MRIKLKIVLGMLVSLILLPLPRPTTSAPAMAAPERVVRFLGERAADVLAGATRVEVFRLGKERAKEGQAGVGGYKVTGGGTEQGEVFARELAAVLFDEKSYQFESDKQCPFEPAAGLRVWAGERRAEVVLCFACDQIAVFSPNPEDGSIRSAMKGFDPGRAALVKLTKRALPDDVQIQKLREQREPERN